MALLSLVAKLGLDKTGFEQGLNKAGEKVKSFGADLKSQLAGAFSVAAVGAFLRSIATTIGRIKDLSEQFGVTTDEVQRVDYALKQSGMSFEDFGAAIGRMNSIRKEAVEGNIELRKTLDRYGITLEQLNSPLRSSSSLVLQLANEMAKGGVTAKEQADFVQLFGDKAAKLASVLANLNEVQPPAMFSDKDIEQVDAMTKAFERLYLQMQVIAARAITSDIRNFSNTIEAITGSDKTIKERFAAIAKTARDVADQIFTGGAFRRANAIADVIAPAKPDAAQNAKEANKLANEAAAMQAGPGLFEIDKNLKQHGTSSTKTPFGSLTSADQLGRIGAFSGGGVGTLQGQMKKTADTLVEIRNVLAIRGIVIKDL